MAINNFSIEAVQVFKYIGVYIVSHFTWHAQINNLIKNKTYKLRLIRDALMQDQLITLYYALAQSNMSYSKIPWEVLVRLLFLN